MGGNNWQVNWFSHANRSMWMHSSCVACTISVNIMLWFVLFTTIQNALWEQKYREIRLISLPPNRLCFDILLFVCMVKKALYCRNWLRGGEKDTFEGFRFWFWMKYRIFDRLQTRWPSAPPCSAVQDNTTNSFQLWQMHNPIHTHNNSFNCALIEWGRSNENNSFLAVSFSTRNHQAFNMLRMFEFDNRWYILFSRQNFTRFVVSKCVIIYDAFLEFCDMKC